MRALTAMSGKPSLVASPTAMADAGGSASSPTAGRYLAERRVAHVAPEADAPVFAEHDEVDVAAKVDVGGNDGARDKRRLCRERSRRDVGKRPVAVVAPDDQRRLGATVARRAAEHQVDVAIVVEIDEGRSPDVERRDDAGRRR